MICTINFLILLIQSHILRADIKIHIDEKVEKKAQRDTTKVIVVIIDITSHTTAHLDICHHTPMYVITVTKMILLHNRGVMVWKQNSRILGFSRFLNRAVSTPATLYSGTNRIIYGLSFWTNIRYPHAPWVCMSQTYFSN